MSKSIERILKIGSFILILEVLSKLLGYAFTVLLVKSIPAEAYGKFVFSLGVVMFSSSVFLFGIPQAVGRFIAFYRGKSEDTRDVIATGGVSTLAVIVVCSMLLLGLYIVFPSLFSFGYPTLFLILALFAFNSVFAYTASIMKGFERPHLISILETLRQILKFVFILIVLWFTKSFFWIILSLLLAFAIPSLISAVYVVRRHWKDRGRLNPSVLRKLILFGIPSTVTSIAWSVLGWADIFIIRLLAGFNSIGVFYVANQVANVLLIVVGPFMQILEPVTARLFGEGRGESVKKQNALLLAGFTVIYIPIVAAIFAFSHPILSILFKPEYATPDGIWSLRILSVAIVFFGLSRIYLRTIEAAGSPIVVAKITATAAAVNVVGDYLFFVPRYGIVGAAISDLIVASIVLTAAYWHANKPTT